MSVYIRVTTVYAENGTNITTRSWIRKFPSVFLIAFWERWEGRKELRGTIGMNPTPKLWIWMKSLGTQLGS